MSFWRQNAPFFAATRTEFSWRQFLFANELFFSIKVQILPIN